MTTPSNTASSLLPGHFPLEPTCFSPWELASLKVVYHRFDDRHKGYLDADDLRRVCTACHLVLTAEEFRTLVVVMDANGDERFSFEEFVTFLALSGPDHPGAVQMRERLMSADAASLTAGAALGILPFVKHQLFVILGTLFYDPIRLFRDSFVDYSATLRHRLHVREQRNSNTAAASGGVQSSASSSGYTACTRRMNVSSSSCATPDASLLHVARAHARGSHIGKTFGWLTYTISLDCVVGAAMFLSYSRARRWCIEQGEVIHHRNTRRAHHQESLHGRNRMSDNDVRVNCATATAPTEANDIMFTSECCLGDQSGNATAPTVSGLLFNEVADPMHRQAWRERPVARMQRLLEIVPGLAMHGHPLRLEAVAGGVGGAVSGLCQGPCHYLATFGNANISGHLQHHHASVDDAASSMATRAATHQEAAS